MKDTSIVQKIFTWAVVIVLVILGLNVLLKRETLEIQSYPTHEPKEGPAPTTVIYPNNGKE